MTPSGSDEVNVMTESTHLRTNPTPTEFTVDGRHGVPVTFKGVLLATESSHTSRHTHEGDFAPQGWRCGACRWFEVALYRVMDDDQPRDNVYMVHTRGMTIKPDEIIYARAAWAETPYKVLQLLTQWKSNSESPMLPETSYEALKTAGKLDPTIAHALNEWLDAGA